MGTEGLMNGLSSVLYPQVGKRGQGRTHPSYFPIPTPRLVETNEKRAFEIVSSVKEACKIRILSFAQKGKNRTILQKC
jgi:hypothetical protein